MNKRRRINVSIDSDTYNRLLQLQERRGFKTSGEIVAALVHILLDRLEAPPGREYDLPEDDGEYINRMFEDLGLAQKNDP